MKKSEKVSYWLKSAEKDWRVAGHLFDKKDYAYALFFGHLTLEKTLKALWAAGVNEQPPLTHRLLFLSERLGLDLSPEQTELLETVTDFNLEARYPDERFSFQKKCTKRFAERHLKKIMEMRRWLLKQIR